MHAIALEQTPSASLTGKHTLWQSVGLHLLPGVITGALYYLLAQPVANLGLPSIVALMAAGVLGILPFELGVIAWAAKSSGQPFLAMIAYRRPLAWWQYLVMAPLLIVVTGLIFTLFAPITGYFESLFAWLPASMVMNLGIDGGYTRNILTWVTVLNGLLLALVLPVVEEFYFRGFLLPRMPDSLKGWAPLAHSFLFALYHFWSPYMVAVRTVGLLPQIYLVRGKGNLYVGMIAHCFVNFLDVAAMIAVVSG